MIQVCALLSCAAGQHPSMVPITDDSMVAPRMLLRLLAVITLTAHKLQLNKQAVTHAEPSMSAWRQTRWPKPEREKSRDN